MTFNGGQTACLCRIRIKRFLPRVSRELWPPKHRICDVNGESGRLIYRGYDVDELAAASTFEEVAYLLLYGDLPTPFQLDEFRTALHRQMTLPEPVDEFLRRLPADVSPMAALEAAVAYAGLYDTDGDSVAAAHRKARASHRPVADNGGCDRTVCGPARSRLLPT